AWTLLLGLGGAGVILLAGVTINAFGLRLAAIAAPALVPNILNACLSGILLGRARVRLWNVIQILPPLLTLAGMLLVVVGLDGGVDAAVGGAGVILLAGVTINAFGLRLAAIAAPALVPNILNACLSGILLGRARVRLWNVIQILPPLLTLAGMLLVVVGLDGGVDAAVG